MKDLHLTRNDFEVEWYSGTGGGGQHRNKHRNCCRIRHIETGITAVGTAHKERSANRKDAFHVLAARLVDHFNPGTANARRADGPVVRTYSEPRNEVLDHASRKRVPYKRVVIDGEIGELVEARRAVMAIGDA